MQLYLFDIYSKETQSNLLSTNSQSGTQFEKTTAPPKNIQFTMSCFKQNKKKNGGMFVFNIYSLK